MKIDRVFLFEIWWCLDTGHPILAEQRGTPRGQYGYLDDFDVK